MNSFITNQNLWASKSRNVVFVHECSRMCRSVGLDRLILHPNVKVFGDDHNVSHSFCGMGMDLSYIINFSLLEEKLKVKIHRVTSPCRGHSSHTSDKYHIA